MRRRRFLVAVGASLVLAGCSSQDSAIGGDPGTDTPADGGSTDTASGTPTETVGAPATDLGDFVLGETTGDVNPHGLTVRNDGENTRTVELQVTDADTDETLLDRSYTLGAGSAVSGTLRGPATYEMRVAVPEAETEHRRTVDHFDTCNEYGTTATVNPDGSITSRMVSTAVACDPDETPPPETPPLDGFTLGETTGDVNPHGLTVRNDGEDSRTGRLQITDADTDETLLDRSYTLGGGETIGGELRGPATYEVRVTVSGPGTEHRTTVEYFDTCNSYGTTVTIAPDGAISSEMIRTLIACDPGETPPDEAPPPDGFALGETTGDVNPHGLTVYNRGDTARTVEFRVTEAGETLLDRSFTLDGDEGISGELRGPATYEVRVAIPEAGTEEVTTVEYFDTCNDYGTNVTIDSAGSVSTNPFRTDALCSG